MQYFLKRTISVASFSGMVILSGCKTSVEDYAKQWCDLNNQIETCAPADQEKLIDQAIQLENEIKNAYGSDKASMDKITQLTNECD